MIFDARFVIFITSSLMKYQSREIRKEFIMGSKITIIGAGSVGSTIAHILSLKPYVSELVMIDILKDKADGEIMDMAQGTGFRDPISMISGDYEDAAAYRANNITAS